MNRMLVIPEIWCPAEWLENPESIPAEITVSPLGGNAFVLDAKERGFWSKLLGIK